MKNMKNGNSRCELDTVMLVRSEDGGNIQKINLTTHQKRERGDDDEENSIQRSEKPHFQCLRSLDAHIHS